MFDQKTEKRVAVFFADGLEECEALIVTDILHRAGIPCDKVAITGNLAVTSSHGVVVVCDGTIEDEGFSFDDYDMLVLPGGMPGTTNLADCAPLADAIRAFAAEGKDLAAICAAPTVFAQMGLLEGKTATCYPDMQGILPEHGAVVSEGEVVIDGNFITSMGMGTAIEFGLALVERVLGAECSRAIREQVVYLH